jgi:hypothetical protein
MAMHSSPLRQASRLWYIPKRSQKLGLLSFFKCILKINMTEKIINNGNWFLAEIIEKYEPLDSNKTQVMRRVTTWGNYHLIYAESPDEAYDKAVIIGKESNYTFTNSDKMKMKSEFLGIGDLLPIKEDIEDGAEIFWNDYGFISAKRSERLTLTKKELLDRLKLK